MLNVRNLGWTQHNAVRRYPLTESSSAWDRTRSFNIPDDFLISLYLAVPDALTTSVSGFYIYSIGAYANGFQITIGFGEQQIATVLIPRATHQKYKTYEFTGLGNYYDVRGSVGIGDLANISNQPPGTFFFDEPDARIEPDCIRPFLRSIPSIQVRNGDNLSERFSGDIRLAAGTNTYIEIDAASTPPRIVFHAIEGAGLNNTDPCGESSGLVPIMSINGVPPRSDGQFFILGDGDCLNITTGEARLTLSDACSKPCCGNKELETVVQAVENLRQQVETLENKIAALEESVAGLETLHFRGALGDGGCQT